MTTEELISGIGVIRRCCSDLRLEKKIAQGSCYMLYRLLHSSSIFDVYSGIYVCYLIATW